MSESFAAVVVTYNRKALLAECLEALIQQSLILAKIYVIDNASTDGTSEHLERRGFLNHPSIQYIRLPSNIGGAGGFHAGIKAAFEGNHEWIWVMDDDAEPRADAFERLALYAKFPKIVAIASQKVDRSGNLTSDGIRILRSSGAGRYDYTQLRFASFVGMAIKRSAIERIGLPKPEFFIHHDDTEYCMRLRRIGDIALAPESIVAHKEIARNGVQRTILGQKVVRYPIDSFCFNFYQYRNFAWILKQYSQSPVRLYAQVACRFLLSSMAALTMDRDHRFLRLTIIAKATLDGLRGHFDNTTPARLLARIK